MAKITLSNVASGYNRQNINTNFEDLAAELQNKVFYRDNPDGEPNQMEQDIDMNSNDIANAKDIYTTRVNINGKWVIASEETSARLADTVTYDNTTSLLTATNAQTAIDEVEGRVDTAETAITTVEGRLDDVGDESVTTSTGTQAVATALDDRVIAVNSVAEIEAISLAAVGDVISLNAGGRSGVFDVIAGDFSSELTADTENGVYVGLSDDPTSATKVAKRRHTGTLNVKWFGAVGDSVADDTTALQAACAFGEAVVFIPAGNYLVTESINPNPTDSSRFYGEPTIPGYGGGPSTIVFDDALLTNSDACITGCVSILNITISGTSKNAIGVSFNNKTGVAGNFGSYVAEDCWVSGCFKGYFFDSMYSSRFVNLNAFGNIHGFWVEPVLISNNSGYLTDTLFISCASNQNTGYSWYVAPPIKSPTVTFSNCTFEGTSTIVDYIAYFNNNLDPFYIENLYLEGEGGTSGTWRVSGRGEVSGLYQNSVGTIDSSSGGCDVAYRNVNMTSGSGGFGPSSANTTGFALHNGNAHSLPSTFSGGDFLNASIAGSNKLWNFKRTTDAVSITADGTANDLFSLGINSSFSSSSFTVPFNFSVSVAGIRRQQAAGILVISYIAFDGVSAASSSDIAVSQIAESTVSGTLSTPSFTLSSSGASLVVRAAITTSLSNASCSFAFDINDVIQPTTILPEINRL